MLPASCPQTSLPFSATSANPKRTPKVPTTFSFAIRPVTAATAIFQSPQPERDKERCDDASDLGKDTVIQLLCLQHSEGTVNPAKVHQEPQNDGGKENDGAGLFDEGPCTLPHASQYIADGRHMVGRKLHNEGSRISGRRVLFPLR